MWLLARYMYRQDIYILSTRGAVHNGKEIGLHVFHNTVSLMVHVWRVESDVYARRLEMQCSVMDDLLDYVGTRGRVRRIV